MEVMLLVFMSMLGASIGSFVNVLADRLPRGENIFISRSHCENCQKKLTLLELIPVVSYVFLLGRCKKCKAKIPLRLFIVEVLAGILFLVLTLFYTSLLISLPFFTFLLVVTPAMLAIFFSDLEYGIIPDELVTAIIVPTVVYLGLFKLELIINHIISGIGAFLLFLSLFLATKGKGMGFGDVKLALVLGFLLGFPSIIVGLYGAFLTGALVSIILVLWRKKKLRGGTVPFGPFLIASSYAAIFLGDAAINFFLRLL